MANHSSILAWRITWTGEPGGLTESDTTEWLTQYAKMVIVLTCFFRSRGGNKCLSMWDTVKNATVIRNI